jgi:hypothetical protein
MAMTSAGISKMESVRRAIKELGKDAMPLDIQSFLKSNFGLAMTAAHISNYKTDILRKRSGRGRMKKVIVRKAWGKKTMKMSKNGQTLNFEDIEAVKGLVGRVGGETLMNLIDLLGK